MSESKLIELKDLVGYVLSDDGWKVEQFIAVYTTDCQGRTESRLPVGLYRDQVVADAIKKQEIYINLRPVLVLTNGVQAFLLNSNPVPVCDDEVKKLELREKALAKLSSEERAVLGFSQA